MILLSTQPSNVGSPENRTKDCELNSKFTIFSVDALTYAYNEMIMT